MKTTSNTTLNTNAGNPWLEAIVKDFDCACDGYSKACQQLVDTAVAAGYTEAQILSMMEQYTLEQLSKVLKTPTPND